MASGDVMLAGSYGSGASSNSCADVLAGVGVAQMGIGSSFFAVACSSDPVIVGTNIIFGSSTVYPVTSITATPRNEMLPYKATTEEYTAVSIIFGLILTAACLVWGAKQILNLIRDRPEV